MRNPISLTQIKAKNLTLKHEKLYEEHCRLIEDSVEIENSLEKFKDAVGEFCNSCNLKSTRECSECYLYKVATENELWKEL